MNQAVLVGRITELTETDKDRLLVKIEVQRPYLNAKGEHDTDIVPCMIKGSLASNTKEYCTVGDILGIRGSFIAEGDMTYVMADKVTFLAQKSKDESEDDPGE